MGENLHKDNFEEFLKRNLDRLQPLPDEEVWDKINLALDHQPTPSTNKPTSLNWKWPIMGLALVILGLTSFYYYQKYQNLNEKYTTDKDAQQNLINTTDYNTSNTTESGVSITTSSESSNSQQLTTTKRSVTEENKMPETTNHTSSSKINKSIANSNSRLTISAKKISGSSKQENQSYTYPLREIKNISTNLTKNVTQFNESKNSILSSDKAIGVNLSKLEILHQKSTTRNSILYQDNNIESPLQKDNVTLDPEEQIMEQPNSELNKLHVILSHQLTSSVVFTPTINSPKLISPQIKKATKLSLSLNAAISTVQNKLSSEIVVTGPFPSTRAPENTVAGINKKINLTINNSLNRHFNYGLGIGYSVYNYDFVLRPDIRCKDKRQRPNDPFGMRNFDFNHHIFTGNGEFDLDLRTSEISTQYNDNDPINVSVEVEQKTEYLTFPFRLMWQNNQRRFNVNAGLEILNNILLSNNIPVAQVDIKDHFRPDKMFTKAKQDDLRKYSMDLSFMANVDFRFTQKCSVSAGPLFSTSIISKLNNDKFTTRSYSIGANLGLNYRF